MSLWDASFPLLKKVFNIGQYRRKFALDSSSNNFFRADNKEAQEIREKCALLAIQDAIQFLRAEGEVVLLDATNTTLQRRELLKKHFTVDNPFHLFFVESICNDPAVIEANILDVKVDGPDYRGQDRESAVKDFLQRIEHYREVYEPVGGEGEEDTPYIQMIDCGAQFVVNKPVGRLQSRVLSYLMKMRVFPRTFYFTRPGVSSRTTENGVGWVGDLTDHGWMYAAELRDFLRKEKVKEVEVWSCEGTPSQQTATFVSSNATAWPALTLTQQSHQNMIARLEPVIMELQHSTNVMVICEEPVLQCLLAYFQGKTAEDAPNIAVPMHTILRVATASDGYSIAHEPIL